LPYLRWRKTTLETIIEIQSRVGQEPVFQLFAVEILEGHIGKAVQNGLLNTDREVRFVTAVEGLTAVTIAKQKKMRYIDGSTMAEAIQKNHYPAEPPWKCVTQLMRRRPELLHEIDGLKQFVE
jgi:hypothetical protein